VSGHDGRREVEHDAEVLGEITPVWIGEVDHPGLDARLLDAFARLRVAEARNAPDLVVGCQARRQRKCDLAGGAGDENLLVAKPGHALPSFWVRG
jgi:hypothetical protein